MKEATAPGYIEHLKTITIIEACKIFEVSRWTLWRMVKASNIKGKKERGQIIYTRSELEQLFKPIQYNVIELTV